MVSLMTRRGAMVTRHPSRPADTATRMLPVTMRQRKTMRHATVDAQADHIGLQSGAGNPAPPEPAVDIRISVSASLGRSTSTTPPLPAASAAPGASTPDALGPSLQSMQQTMESMQQSMVSMQHSMLAMQASTQLQLAVQGNSAIRLYHREAFHKNRYCAHTLLILAKENTHGTIPVGTKPNYLKDKDKPHAIFPYDYIGLYDLTASQLDALEEFYGQKFQGDTVEIRRLLFSRYFIGYKDQVR